MSKDDETFKNKFKRIATELTVDVHVWLFHERL